MACRVFYNNDGTISSVQDEAGNPSQLYSGALQITNNPQRALEIWSVAYSEDFQAAQPFQTEPAVETVMDFIRRNNNRSKRLSKNDIDGLTNNSLSIPFNYIEEIYAQSRNFYQNGVFTVNRSTLRATNFYTEEEIDNILGDQQLQEQIKTVVDRIEGQVSLNNSEREIPLANYESPELAQSINTSETTGLGKFTQENPFIIDAQLRETVGGIKTREDFESIFYAFADEAIVERYAIDANYADKLFENYSSMSRMQLLEDDSEGGLSAIPQTPIRAFTEQVLVVGQDSSNLRSIVDLLIATPRQVWTNSGVEIEDMLIRAEDYAAELGIDIIGISEQDYDYEQMMSFLASIENLAAQAEQTTVQQEDVDAFVDNYNNVFAVNLNPRYTAQEVKAKNNGKTLVKVDTTKSEQQLFDEYSLVKAEDGIYQRISKQEDIEGLYDYVVDLVQFNPNVIEKKALYPSAYSGSNFSYRKAADPSNRENVRQDLVRYVQQQPFSEGLTLYKIAFGHPLVFKPAQKNMMQEYAKSAEITQDYNYLTTDFIADFGKIYLQEKIKDSTLFKKLLSHFTFNSSGIILKDTDPYSKQEVNLFTPQTGTLSYIKQYAAISKNDSLNSLYDYQISEDVIIDRNFERVFYINNPEQLPQKTIQYEYSENRDYLATQNLQDDFININGNIFEKARNYKNISIYERLPAPPSDNFSNYKIEYTTNSDVNVTQFKELIQSLENVSKAEKLYSKKEEKTIDEDKICR